MKGYKTIDGIDVCGLRVAHEIMDQIKNLNKEGRVTKFSIVGYSLGGLISRYSIGILYHQNYFQTIKPVNFITFCTPHVGVLTPGSNITVKIFNTLVPALLSLSGRQMFLKDLSGKQGPLLSLMASPNSVFYKALSAFKQRSLYANAINDKRTSWWTAGISVVDPFIHIDESSSLNDLNYSYIEGFEPIVLDSSAEIIISNRKINSDEKKSEIIASNFWERKWRWVVVAFNLLFFAPLWVLWFILSGMMESFKSHRRISTTLRENSGFFTSLTELISDEPTSATSEIYSEIDSSDDEYDYNTPAESIRSFDMNFDRHNFEKSLHDQADTLMESVWDAMTSKDETEAAKFAQYDIKYQQSNAGTEPLVEVHDYDNKNDFKVTINELAFFPKDSEYYRNNTLSPFILDLSKEQLEIIKHLNELSWKKYPLLIRNTKSTHSAAIVRDIKDPTLSEGKIVIKHWLENVFQFD